MKFKDYFRLAIDGKWLTRIFTVLLSGIAFALFAMAGVSVTNTFEDACARAVLAREEILVIHNMTGQGAKPLGQKILDEFEGIEEIQSDGGFLYYYGTGILVDVYNYFPIGKSYSHVSGEFLHSDVICGSCEKYGETLSLLAGDYPADKSEVALSEEQYELFKRYGYQDMSDAFYLTDDTNPKQAIDESKAGEVFEINDYADIIGKQINYAAEGFAKVTIVGVLRANYSAEDRALQTWGLSEKIFLAEEWREDLKGQDEQCTVLYAKAIKSQTAAEKVVQATFAAQQISYEEYGGSQGVSSVAAGVYPVYEMNDVAGTFTSFLVLLGAIALLLGVFAFILNIYLIGSSIRRKEKKIGILRALGANNKLVKKIFFTEALFMAILIFIFALLVTLITFYVVLYPMFFIERYGISLFLLKPVNYLILAACCFVIPLLAALIPIKRFFKKPIVSNIKGK